MEPRRPRLDPLLAEQANERLAFVLADRGPRRAQTSTDGQPAADDQPVLTGAVETPTSRAPGPAPDPPADPPAEPAELGLVDDLPAMRRFNRRHLSVLAVLVALGLIGGGWSLLRARPVAVASPGEVLVSAPVVPSGRPPTATPSPATTIVVHVLGAVKRPGLVKLADRTRVQDAIDAAGGFTRGADPGELNLAQPLADGQQILIGSRNKPAGEVRDGAAGAGPGAGGSTSGAAVDLNRATEAQLEELPGVGPVMAGKIVAWRTEHSRFSRVEELQEVDGVGPKTYAQIAPHVRV